MSGQSIMDRVTAAKHSIAGSGLAKTVCKATTEEVMGPKKKHLDYLLQCTNEPNVSIPQLADLLIERTQNTSWVIVFKALVTIHNLMNYGNERFTQYLASNNCTFNLANFIDKTGVQGYDMSTFIRRYSKYLNEKATSYRIMAFDFCKVKRGRDDGLLRTMNSEKILKTLPVLQKQIDALLEFDCTPNELTNGVINATFMLLFKDLIRLFACYNDGTINLLEKYFDMNKKHCKEALDIYKKFLVRMDKVAEFLKVAENVGIDKGDIPDLAKGLKGNSEAAPASLLDALEQHLQSLEGKKGVQTVSTPKPSGFSSAINTIAGNSSIQISEEEKKKILDDENKRLQQLKLSTGLEQKERETVTSTNPFANNVSQPAPTSTTQAPSPGKPSDDLLNLTGNPFAESVQNVMVMNSGVSAMQPQFGAPAPAPAPGWGTQPNSTGFSDNNFAVFPNGAPAGASFDAFGEVMKPQTDPAQNATPKTQEKLAGKDLDTNLVELAGSLAINGSNKVKTQHQWQPKGDQKLTGGSNWAPQATQSMTWTQPTFQQSPQHMPGMMYTGQPVMGAPMMQPGMVQPGMVGARMVPPAMGMGMPVGGPMMGQPAAVGMGQPMYGAVRPGMPAMPMGQPRPPASQPNDPFGAL